MSQPRGWKPTLRYSPVNGIIVDWGIGSQPFALCGLPTRACEGPPPTPEPPPCDGGQTVVEAVDTYDWHRWVPEIVVGLEGANEDMAASYARRVAIEFATKSWVLQRQVAVSLQPGVFRYPVEPFEDERAIGVLSIDSDKGGCACSNCAGIFIGDVHLDQARQELVFTPPAGACGCHMGQGGPNHLLVTVWASPTEDSCRHDVFLYERYREQIARGARGRFMAEAHAYGAYKTNRGYASARGDQLMFNRADRAEAQLREDIRKARVEATAPVSASMQQQPPALWGSGCCGVTR